MKKPSAAAVAVSRSKRKRNEPLESQLLKDKVVLTKKKPSAQLRNEKSESEEEAAERLDAKQMDRILREAKLQQQELEKETQSASPQGGTGQPSEAFASLSESDDGQGYGSGHESESENDYEAELAEEQEAAELEKMSPYDRQLFEKWSQPVDGGAGRSLSDMILDKLNAGAALPESAGVDGEGQGGSQAPMNAKVVEVYQKLGVLLKQYKSGKLPKAFKVLPALKNWEQVLLLTQPAEWSPHSVYQATRLFSSTLKPWQAQRYYTAVLLPHVREGIQGNSESGKRHRLNTHLYAALCKSIYKPSAFFKGILLPLAESGDCTLKEAAILSSVMAKTSLPVLHASAALLKLAEMQYSGANSIFIRTLLDKKFTLPYRVIDELVLHFSRFEQEEQELTVLWHQSLLVFCQRYKQELTSEQRQAILKLIRAKNHPMISSEISRELHSAGDSNRESTEPPTMQDA